MQMNLTIYGPDIPNSVSSQLDNLMQKTFGFRFDLWRKHGGWTDDYSSYSIIENGRMLANACAFHMDLICNGKAVEAVQIGAVATRLDRRGEGLSRHVMEGLLEQWDDRPCLLLPNDSVMRFYPRFGFRLVPQSHPWLPFQPTSKPGGEMHRIPAGDAPAWIPRYLEQRKCTSRLLDCTNAAPAVWFHLLYEYQSDIYHIPGLETLLVLRQEENDLILIDIATRQPITYKDLAPHLAFPGVKRIRFGFNPDWLDVEPCWEDPAGDPLFVRGEWDLPERFVIPWMLRT
jgi:hypothetical protein